MNYTCGGTDENLSFTKLSSELSDYEGTLLTLSFVPLILNPEIMSLV